ncbi:hypothetical protein [Amycolatopsis sp. NPDC051102]|uniref:hypothetical protein n=1 Tax=Amycolatopsis sp. NPDC051102 TaxID=3155163 RepID=UPI0034303FFB
MPVVRWFVVSVALWFALRAMNGLLGGVQVDGLVSGDVESIAWGSPAGVVDRTTALLQTWAAPGPARGLVTAVMLAYFAVDLVFIAGYVLLLRELYKRVQEFAGVAAPYSLSPLHFLTTLTARGRTVLVCVIGVADLAENVTRLALYLQVGSPGVRAGTVLVVVAYACTVVKFGGILLVAWSVVEWLRSGAFRAELRNRLRVLGRSLWRLRLAVAAAGLFAVLVLFEPTGQVSDLVRRWADDGAFPWTPAVAAFGVLQLGGVVWWTTRRLVLSRWSQASAGVPSCLLLVVGLAVAFAAALSGWKPLYGLAIVAGALGLLGLWWDRSSAGEPEIVVAESEGAAENKRRRDAGRPPAAQRNRIRALARGFAVVPMVALTAAAVTAFTPVMFVLPAAGRAWTGPFKVAVIVLAVAFFLTPFVAVLGIRLLRKADSASPVAAEENPGLSVFQWLLVLVAVAYPVLVLVLAIVTDLPAFSALPVTAAFLSLALLALTELQRLTERYKVPSGLLFLGFSRTPASLLLVVVFVVSSLGPLNDGSSHAAYHTAGPAPAGAGADLGTRWTQWKGANCVDRKSGVVPLVLVASPGGGQRAAYWTASSLTRLVGTERARPGCPGGTKASAVFALGGASGGSLGNTEWVAALGGGTADWYRQALLAHDYLSDPFAWMLTVDLARAVVGFPGPDRARRLEERWERSQPALAQDFFTQDPLLLLTGTQVESGCRLNISALRLVQRGDVCGAIAAGAGAPATADLLDYVCDRAGKPAGTLSRSTAALLSARFPYVSPSAQLYRCDDGARIADVDGGYADNTGIDSMLALWQRLEPLVAAHNRTGAGATVVPVFVMLDNHYRTVASAVPPARTQELFVPPSTRDRTDQLDDLIAEQRARAAFTGPVPGRAGPACGLGSGGSRFVAVRPAKSPGSRPRWPGRSRRSRSRTSTSSATRPCRPSRRRTSAGGCGKPGQPADDRERAAVAG